MCVLSRDWGAPIEVAFLTLEAAAGICRVFRSGSLLWVTKDSAVFEDGGAWALYGVARSSENGGVRCAERFFRKDFVSFYISLEKRLVLISCFCALCCAQKYKYG